MNSTSENGMGKLIVLEGVDGVGKSAASAYLASYLNEAGYETVLLSFPGKQSGTLGGHIYKLHHNPKGFDVDSIHPLSMQILHIAAHIDVINRVILPTLEAGVNVVLDRFWWSTIVYGCNAQVSEAQLRAALATEFNEWRGVVPEALIWITRDSSSDLDEYSLARLQEAYYRLYISEHDAYPVHHLQNNGTLADLMDNVTAIVDKIFAPQKRKKKTFSP